MKCAAGTHSSFSDDADLRQPDGYRAAFLSEIRFLQKDLPCLQDPKLIFDCCWLQGEFKEIETLLTKDNLDGPILDLHRTWRQLDEKITKWLDQNPEYQVATSR